MRAAANPGKRFLDLVAQFEQRHTDDGRCVGGGLVGTLSTARFVDPQKVTRAATHPILRWPWLDIHAPPPDHLAAKWSYLEIPMPETEDIAMRRASNRHLDGQSTAHRIEASTEPGSSGDHPEPTVSSLGQAIEICISWQKVCSKRDPSLGPQLADLRLA